MTNPRNTVGAASSNARPQQVENIQDMRWADLSPELQQALADKMLRLKEYLGLLGTPSRRPAVAPPAGINRPSPSRQSVDERRQALLQKLKSKPHYEQLRTHMVFRGGKPIGMLTSVPDEKSQSVYIDHLYVDPDQRNAGVGTSLLQSVMSQAKAAGARKIRLGVDYKNIAARRLYERLGLQPHALLLEKDLHG